MEIYRKTPVGRDGTIRPAGGQLDGFQSVVLAVQAMQNNGLILIKELHKESQTGKRYVDLIRFRRVK